MDQDKRDKLEELVNELVAWRVDSMRFVCEKCKGTLRLRRVTPTGDHKFVTVELNCAHYCDEPPSAA
jgi:hypothetical protein